MRSALSKRLLKEVKKLNNVNIRRISSATPSFQQARGASVSHAEFATSKNDSRILLPRFPDFSVHNEQNISEVIWKDLRVWGDKIALRSNIFLKLKWDQLGDTVYSILQELLESVNIQLRNQICGKTRRSYTYDQLHKCSNNFAASLITKLGLSKGDRVAVMIPNCPEYPVVLLGTLQAGGVCTTINPGYKQFELTHQLKLTEPSMIITNKEFYPVVQKTLNDLKSNIKVIIVDRNNEDIPEGTIRYTELAENDIDTSVLKDVNVVQDDLATLLFSSGTTGLPKAVEITHKNLIYTVKTTQQDVVKAADITTKSHQDHAAAIIPFFHVYGLVTVMLGHLSLGCRLITMERYSPEGMIDVLHRDRTTILCAVPPLVMFMAKDPRVKPEHLVSLRVVLSAAAPLAKSDVDIMMEKTKGATAFMQGYGLTETTAFAASMLNGPGTRERDFDSCGEVVPICKIKIVDLESGESLPPDMPGDLWLAGPNVTRGYYRNPEATRDSLTEDGYFKTGDLAYYKPNGDIYIKERIKELIKVKGMQVAPAELEALLRSHPDVAEAGVIGVPHELYGEVPKAFVKLKADKKPDEEALKKFVEDHVAVYKKIKEVVFISELPKTTSGKILRRELKNMK